MHLKQIFREIKPMEDLDDEAECDQFGSLKIDNCQDAMMCSDNKENLYEDEEKKDTMNSSQDA